MQGNSLGRTWILAVTSCALLAMAGTASATIRIQTVPVGNVGNAPDPLTGYGAVNYAYNIGEYDVTASQYTAFLNAVGGVDTYALYSPAMGYSISSFGCGITQSGGGTLANPYTYTVAAGFVNRPVTSVSYWDACRFVNWLANGQPTGAEGAGTTETGTYTLTATGIADNTITRNTGSTWVVPSENEWYKAAYYASATRSYYFYPTGSNGIPGSNLLDPSGDDANTNSGSGPYPIDPPYYTTVVGQFQNSASPYGTFDQGGNVWQWNEAIIDVDYRGLRAGSFYYNYVNLRSTLQYNLIPTYQDIDVGFRVAQLPEPASVGILSVGVAGLLVRRRHR